MSEITDQQRLDLLVAKSMAASGVPIFIARKRTEDGDYIPPREWQKVDPNPDKVDDWRPGDALCMVTGHGFDGIDIDPRNGGSEQDLINEGILPEEILGRASTPSGGTHLLIRSIGVRSRDSILPGIDLKAGQQGRGHGFLYIAPTERVHGTYVWEQEPDIDALEDNPLESDDALASHVQKLRSRVQDVGGYSHDSTPYEDLSDERREAADDHVEAIVHDWQVKLAEASVWKEGERDEQGRGWEALARDCAWSIAALSSAGWTGVSESDGRKLYEKILPEVIAQDPKCSGKWYPGLVEKAGAQTVTLPPWWADELMDSTDVLRHIRDVALSKVVVPEALLAAVLGRVLFEVPTEIRLPAVTGSEGSLNIGVVLAGHPGSGKSALIELSRSVMGMVGLDQESYENGLGSGEGFIELFLQPGEKELKNGETRPDWDNMVLSDDPRAIVLVDEVQTLEAFTSRQGNTSSTMVRTALTGGALSTANTRAGGRKRHVPSKSYRTLVIVGVQPRHSDALLSEEESAGGTPQRFLWASMMDPAMSRQRVEEARKRVKKEALDWDVPLNLPRLVKYPQEVLDEVWEASLRQVAKDPTDATVETYAEGHLLLLRLKVAFALAILHRETEITMRWWQMAGVLTDGSLQVQQECRAVVGKSLARSARVRELSKATAVAEATGSRVASAAKQVASRVRSNSNGEWLPWYRVRPSVAARHGLETSDIVEEVRQVDPEIEIEEEDRTGAAPIRRFRYVGS